MCREHHDRSQSARIVAVQANSQGMIGNMLHLLAAFRIMLSHRNPNVCCTMQAAKAMPSANHRSFTWNKARTDFRVNMAETDDSKVRFAVQLAEVQLETLHIRIQHFKEMQRTSPATCAPM